MNKRAKVWEVKTRPDLLTPILEAKHETAYELISQAFTLLDDFYDRVKRILDERGIVGVFRLKYRCYSEELVRACRTYKGEALLTKAIAITSKYVEYGCDPVILREIASLLGLDVSPAFKKVKVVTKTVVQPINVTPYLILGGLLFD